LLSCSHALLIDEAILAQVIAVSQEDALNASIATLEESVLSETIAASLQSANINSTSQDTIETAPRGDADVDATSVPTKEEENDNLLLDTLGDAQFGSGIENCPHLKEAVKLPKIRKILTATHPAADLDHCHGCLDDHARYTAFTKSRGISLAMLSLTETIDELLDPLPLDALWLCLSCSEINCGRMFKKHAIAHHDKRTNNHPLAMNLGSMDVW